MYIFPSRQNINMFCREMKCQFSSIAHLPGVSAGMSINVGTSALAGVAAASTAVAVGAATAVGTVALAEALTESPNLRSHIDPILTNKHHYLQTLNTLVKRNSLELANLGPRI